MFSLTDIDEHQESDESLFGDPELSLSFRTRSDDGDEIVEREYWFAHAKEWDKWTFSSYEERRCDADVRVNEREWRTVERRHWAEDGSPDVDIPQSVINRLDDMVSSEVIRLQT